jgi:hypothetical protein
VEASTTTTEPTTTTVEPTTTVEASTTIIVDCTYAISPIQNNFSAAGGSGSVSISTQNGCAWIAQSTATWITITSVESGIGSSTVGYFVSPNKTRSTRIGTIIIAGKVFTVNQSKKK